MEKEIERRNDEVAEGKKQSDDNGIEQLSEETVEDVSGGAGLFDALKGMLQAGVKAAVDSL
jgi:hypothetical protein